MYEWMKSRFPLKTSDGKVRIRASQVEWVGTNPAQELKSLGRGGSSKKYSEDFSTAQNGSGKKASDDRNTSHTNSPEEGSCGCCVIEQMIYLLNCQRCLVNCSLFYFVIPFRWKGASHTDPLEVEYKKKVLKVRKLLI